MFCFFLTSIFWQLWFRKERLALDAAAVATAEPTRASSDLATEQAQLARRADTLRRSVAEAEGQLCAAAKQRCDAAADALAQVNEAAQRASEAKAAALRRKQELERTLRELEDSRAKHEAEVRAAAMRVEAALSEAQHLRDAVAAAQAEKEALVEEEKKVHRALAKADFEDNVLREQEEDVARKIAAERARAEHFAVQQRNSSLERAKIDQEVQVKSELVAALRSQLQYVRSLLPATHPLRTV